MGALFILSERGFSCTENVMFWNPCLIKWAELSAADVLWMYSLDMNHEVFVSKVNSWNIHVVMIHNICLYFAATLKWDEKLHPHKQFYFVLFVTLWKGAVRNAQNYFWTCTEHLLFCGEKCAQVGNTHTDLCAPANLESTNPCTGSFQPFILWLAVPGVETEHLDGSRRGERDHEKRRGLHYFTASTGEFEVQKTTYFLCFFFL